MENLLEDERCEHGILWEYECELCEKDHKEFWHDLLFRLGSGDVERGRRIMYDILYPKYID